VSENLKINEEKKMKTKYENEIKKLNKETQDKLNVALSSENYTYKRNTKIGKLQNNIIVKLYHLKHYSEKVTAEKTEQAIFWDLDELVYLLDKKQKSENMSNGKLVNMLKEQTQSLKTQFVNKCVAYANNEFDRLNESYNEMREIYDEHNSLYRAIPYSENYAAIQDELDERYSERVIALGYIKENWEEDWAPHNCSCNGYSRIQKSYKPKDAFGLFKNKMFSIRDSKPLRAGKGKWAAQAEKNALAHYENSILKLALRIEKKELNQDKLEMVTSHIDINIETIISDGKQSVRAWTIIAEGPVQRPHYRYLVK
jgi:hypothetical protein